MKNINGVPLPQHGSNSERFLERFHVCRGAVGSSGAPGMQQLKPKATQPHLCGHASDSRHPPRLAGFAYRTVFLNDEIRFQF